ncbi:MAG: sulfotransferase [Rickettsiales bacterium]|jgi:hypothetical protein|nr:sulfotransferase [Rickettsiales bacterium]
MMKPWLITGIPRSGTTLLAALIDSMEDSVCLNEPLWQQDLAKTSSNADEFVHKLVSDCSQLRAKLHGGESLPDLRRSDGLPVTNYLNDRGEVIVRPALFSRSGLSADFTLAVKHNGLYLGALPQLIASGKFKIIALIRHPLDVLASWRASSLPVSRGELPAAAYFWPEMAALNRQDMALIDKQVQLLELLYRRIHQHEKELILLRYEELVAHPSQLEKLFGRPLGQHHFSISKQAIKPLDIPLELLRKKIKDIAPFARYYYPEF